MEREASVVHKIVFLVVSTLLMLAGVATAQDPITTSAVKRSRFIELKDEAQNEWLRTIRSEECVGYTSVLDEIKSADNLEQQLKEVVTRAAHKGLISRFCLVRVYDVNEEDLNDSVQYVLLTPDGDMAINLGNSRASIIFVSWLKFWPKDKVFNAVWITDHTGEVFWKEEDQYFMIPVGSN